MRYPGLFIFMLVSTLVVGHPSALSSEAAKPTKGSALCRTESLPEEIQTLLKNNFGSWKIQEPGALSPSARERWESEKPLQCPGMTIGQFEKDKTNSYGVLLVPQVQSDAGYKFLVFSPKGEMNTYEVHILDQLGDGGRSNVFIRGVEIGKFLAETSKKKFRVRTGQGILFVDAGLNEYEADIYFWVGDKYEHQPVDY